MERYAYTAYGEPTILDGAGTTTRTASFIGNPYLYTAQEYDTDTGLYHFNARMYEGRKGRFLSHDPIRYPNGANTYAVRNPVNGVDPSGLAIMLPPVLPPPVLPPPTVVLPGPGTAIVVGVGLGIYIDYYTGPLLEPLYRYDPFLDWFIPDGDADIDIDSRKGSCKCRCSVQGSPPAHCPPRYEITYPGS